VSLLCLLSRLLLERLMWRRTALPSMLKMQKTVSPWQRGTREGIESGDGEHYGVSLCS
jgi:hypothetical protein